MFYAYIQLTGSLFSLSNWYNVCRYISSALFELQKSYDRETEVETVIYQPERSEEKEEIEMKVKEDEQIKLFDPRIYELLNKKHLVQIIVKYCIT